MILCYFVSVLCRTTSTGTVRFLLDHLIVRSVELLLFTWAVRAAGFAGAGWGGAGTAPR